MKNAMKKILSVAIATTIVVSFAACGGGTTAPTTPATPAAPAASNAPTNTNAPANNNDGLGNFPSRNISWIVPAPAGAPLDIPTRVILDTVNFGTNVMIENIEGAANVPGILEALNRPADGYTLLTTNVGGMIAQPALVHTGYTPEDFRHIAMLLPVYTIPVIVNVNSGMNTAEDFINFITSGESFLYSATNPGSTTHLAIEYALLQLGVETGTFVPYVGGAEVISAVQSGEVDFGVIPPHTARPNHEAGNTRTIILLGDVPDQMSPGITPIAEFGVYGAGQFNNFLFVSVHRDTPDAIVEYLKECIDEAILSDEYQQYLLTSVSVESLGTVTEEWLTELVHETMESIKEGLALFNFGN
jgi:tripartite-type tricarboxylate transporter receptor subunit TctC